MKAVSVAAAAAVLGAAAAQQDTAWAVVTTPAAETKTTPEAASSTWSEWSTSETPEPATTSTWSEWSTSSTPEAASSSTWSEWSTSKTPDAKTTTTSADNAWGQWSSTSSTPAAASTTTTKANTWFQWSTTSSTPAAASSTSTWSEWQSTSSSPAAASSTWSEWEAQTTTITSYTTQWETSTVYNDEGTSTATWSSWASSSSPAAASSTGTWSTWASPAAASGCQMAISISYGQPIWHPTPTLGANSTTWSEWSSSTPAAASSTGTWSEWSSSSTPVAASSTGTWAQWSSSSTPVVATSSATWSEWQSTSTPVAASSATTWATWSSSSAAAKPTGNSQGGNWGITTNGNKFGMAYSPYTADSQCKDQATISADVAKMASLGFTSVRVYSTDCKTLEYVGAACKANNMKIILGVYISNTGIAGAQKQVSDIVAWAQWDIVELIVVGNEAVFNNYCSASELATFIGTCKSTWQQAGYTGAVTTTDELGIWQSSGSAWCDVVDVVTANLYAFFNPNTAAADAGSFIQAQINDLSKICPGKDVYVMESGWPSAGQCNGVACPSPENQATAIKSIQSAVGAKIIYFSFEDEQWKQPGQYGVEQHWGCANVFENSWGSY